jgi:hypothetical protein
MCVKAVEANACAPIEITGGITILSIIVCLKVLDPIVCNCEFSSKSIFLIVESSNEESPKDFIFAGIIIELVT